MATQIIDLDASWYDHQGDNARWRTAYVGDGAVDSAFLPADTTHTIYLDRVEVRDDGDVWLSFAAVPAGNPDDLIPAFGTGGSFTISSGGQSITIAMSGLDDTSEPYNGTPTNAAAVLAFFNSLPTTDGSRSGTLTLSMPDAPAPSPAPSPSPSAPSPSPSPSPAPSPSPSAPGPSPSPAPSPAPSGEVAPVVEIASAALWGDSATLSGLRPGTRYGVRLRSVDDAGNRSGWTAMVDALTPQTTIPRPQTFISFDVQATSAAWTITVDTDLTDGAGAAVNIVNYQGTVRQDGQPWPQDAITTSVSGVLTPLTPATRYEWRFRTLYSDGSLSDYRTGDFVTTPTASPAPGTPSPSAPAPSPGLGPNHPVPEIVFTPKATSMDWTITPPAGALDNNGNPLRKL